jgi:hypothetical protein
LPGEVVGASWIILRAVAQTERAGPLEGHETANDRQMSSSSNSGFASQSHKVQQRLPGHWEVEEAES